MASSLKNFIHSLDPKSLPRILQIQSGFYDEGLMYEKLGHECCLSTGDVIKVVALDIKKILASNQGSEDATLQSTTVELPLNFPGLCRVVADKTPYVNVQEIVNKVWIGSTQHEQPCFYCSKDMQVENLTIKQGEKFVFMSVEDPNETLTVNCEVKRNGQVHAFPLPLSQEGDFHECQDDQIYTLEEVAKWKIPKSRTRRVLFINTGKAGYSPELLPKNFGSCVVLEAIYELHAVMKFQKEIVHFHSDLDVEVEDVTDHYNINSFLQPLSVKDLLERADTGSPFVVAVIEGSIGNKHSYNLLCPGREIVIYERCQAGRILASEIKNNSSKRHFLIPTSYKGKFKRKPREFPTAYDLEIARNMKEKLHVIATKAFDCPHEEMCSVSVGDEFLIPKYQKSQAVEFGRKCVEAALPCEQIILPKKANKTMLLPMFMEGGFTEVVHDKKQYDLLELCNYFHLPLNVTVAIRDLSIQEDILAGIPCLQLEEEIIDSCLLISNFNNPTEIWEVSVHCLNMSFQFLRKRPEDMVHFPIKSIVEEITEEQYYMMRKYKNQATNPPPRPPKIHIIEESKSSYSTVPVRYLFDTPEDDKNLYGDTTKKWTFNQAASGPGLQSSCQSDLEPQENKEGMDGIATLTDHRRIKDSSSSISVKFRAEQKSKAGSNDKEEEKNKNITEKITKKTPAEYS
ncbi:protein THEMIS isoform X2 [Candoia aspera]|uniref:protein THEMIS isoform X2 n=1 Tax=Candoia aspera TaxID=51853 RepID=UPI002FD86B73